METEDQYEQHLKERAIKNYNYECKGKDYKKKYNILHIFGDKKYFLNEDSIAEVVICGYRLDKNHNVVSYEAYNYSQQTEMYYGIKPEHLFNELEQLFEYLENIKHTN